MGSDNVLAAVESFKKKVGSTRLDVTLCQNSIHCPFESGLSSLAIVLLEVGIKVCCNLWKSAFGCMVSGNVLCAVGSTRLDVTLCEFLYLLKIFF